MMLPRRCPSAATNVLRRQAALVPSSTSKRTLTLSACAATLPVAPFSSRRAFHVSPIHLAETVKVPQMAESITEGTLKQWNKKKGDFVKADEEVATIETDKIDVSVNAPQSGTIVETLANEEDTVQVGGEAVPGPGPGQAKEGGGPEQEGAGAEGTGAKTEPNQDSAPAPHGSREERRVKMSRMRTRIAERLKQSQNTAASLTTFNEIDMSALMAFRARHKDRLLKEKGVKLGFMGAFAKASALALQEIPAANASIEGEGLGDTIVYRDYVDLSVAVSTDKGLVTPVVRNVEGLSIMGIEEAISDLGKKARDNKLTLEDMAGGTFTISNGGVFGSLFGTPILNLPGSAILGMHAINQKPWVVGDKIEPRPIMVVALTYDHRLLDGREAVTFLVKLKQYLEDPALMAL
ncbi:dihydrolipoamide succinyltransferase [Acaromyces ingoldii]|uniref:dihydrolipoyllysine-residue succinyltransferase n=1 Tax=Acaromyces ingoldii TaxID=215250 RepID=A0A316YVJ1_9BASI|nr:dihydrolipoamide succinyltransferase [Acaromyces ingoldii]PWN91755.1 dihydrolipoamide succinyltransferase [Acaromyces ingoldii]